MSKRGAASVHVLLGRMKGSGRRLVPFRTEAEVIHKTMRSADLAGGSLHLKAYNGYKLYRGLRNVMDPTRLSCIGMIGNCLLSVSSLADSA